MFRRYDEQVHDHDHDRRRTDSAREHSHTYRADHAKQLPRRYDERHYPPHYEDRRGKR